MSKTKESKHITILSLDVLITIPPCDVRLVRVVAREMKEAK